MAILFAISQVLARSLHPLGSCLLCSLIPAGMVMSSNPSHEHGVTDTHAPWVPTR